MSYIETEVHSASLPAYRRGTPGKITLNRMGNPGRIDWKEALGNDGRGYMLTDASPDDVTSGSINYTATDPAFLAVIPQGHTMLPTSMVVSFENALGTDNWVSLGFDTGDLYTSGGDAVLTAKNLRTDDAFGSTVLKAYSGGTAIVMADPGASERMIYHWVNAFADTNDMPPNVVEWAPKHSPVLVGPATFFAYIYAATTAPDVKFTFQWVEFESEALPE